MPYYNDLENDMAIWKRLLGRDIELGERFNSPFRLDSDGRSCTLKEWNDAIRFYSFNPKDQQWNGISAKSAWKWFNASPVPNEKSIVKSVKKVPLVYQEKEWDHISLKYWYGLGIVPPDWIKPIRGYITYNVVFTDLGFVYKFDNEFKLYCPYDNKTVKWRGTVKKDNVIFIDNKKDTLVVCKSTKDMLCLIGLLGTKYNYTHSQSEGSLPKCALDFVGERVLFWDNDEVGKMKAYKFEKLGFSLFFVPDGMGKDLTDHYLKYGRWETLKLVLKI